MNPVEQLNLTIWSWIETFRSMRRGVYFMPFLIYLAVQGVVFALLWGFSHPAVSWFMAPLLIRGFGETATHYPNNFAVFPVFFARLDLPMSIFAGAFIFGAATWLFARGFSGANPRFAEATEKARGRYANLLISQLPGTILGAAVLWWSERAAATGHYHGNQLRLVHYGGLFAAIALQAAFAFAMVYVIFEGLPAGRALASSARLASRNAIGSFLLVALPVALHYPALMMFRNESVLITRGAPEVIAGITAGDLLVGLLTNYLVVGSATRFYLARTRARGGNAQ